MVIMELLTAKGEDMKTEFILRYRLVGLSTDLYKKFKTESEARAELYKLKQQDDVYCIKLDKVTHLDV